MLQIYNNAGHSICDVHTKEKTVHRKKKFNMLEELLAQNWTQHVSGNVTQQSKNLTDRYTIIQYLG